MNQSPAIVSLALFVGACMSSSLRPDAGRDTVGTGQAGDGGGAMAGNGGGSGTGIGATGGTATGGAQTDGSIDAPDGGDAASPPVTGRILVVQPSGSAAPDLWTRAWFGLMGVCQGVQAGINGCSCTDSTSGSCVTRSCSGRGGTYWPRSPLLLGYGPGDPLAGYGGLSAGTLEVGSGSVSFMHPAPGNVDVHDTLAAPWLSGDGVRISASGETVPAFSIDVPFPPRVTFLQPDFRSGSVVLDSNTLDVRWTPVDATGTVEVTVSSGFQPDAAYGFSVVRCAAPVSQGQLSVPVVGRGVQPSTASWFQLAFRVVNRGTVQADGLTVDAVVASFDSGPINETPPSSDGGAADGP